MANLASSADLTTTARSSERSPTSTSTPTGKPGNQDIAAVWAYDGRVLDFRAGAADIAAFESLLASLRAVDTNTWLSALPASVVKTTDRAAVITSMLQGVTLPPGFDASTIAGSDLTSDRYQLGAWVTGTVACTWIKLWSNARSTGDTAGVQQAIAAMATAKDWPILKEMATNGEYPQMLETLAAAMRAGACTTSRLKTLPTPASGVPRAASRSPRRIKHPRTRPRARRRVIRLALAVAHGVGGCCSSGKQPVSDSLPQVVAQREIRHGAAAAPAQQG